MSLASRRKDDAIDDTGLPDLAAALRNARGLQGKRDISVALDTLGITSNQSILVGDDCAAIPDPNGGHLLFAIEGFINGFVARDPWFAGWCGVMVNLSDIAAMGGRPLAIVNALWADGGEDAKPVLEGMRAAAAQYGVPVVGGHSNLQSPQSQLAVAILGRAEHLLTSFDARPGQALICAVDLRGAYRGESLNWQAALDAPPTRLRGDLEILPILAEKRLCRAAKDISQAGLVGTAAMLAEASGVGVEIDLATIPRPFGLDLARWLQSFPSFGFLLSVNVADVDDVLNSFTSRDIAAATIGHIADTGQVAIRSGNQKEIVWDFSREALMGCGPKIAAAAQ